MLLWVQATLALITLRWWWASVAVGLQCNLECGAHHQTYHEFVPVKECLTDVRRIIIAFLKKLYRTKLEPWRATVCGCHTKSMLRAWNARFCWNRPTFCYIILLQPKTIVPANKVMSINELFRGVNASNTTDDQSTFSLNITTRIFEDLLGCAQVRL